MEISYDRAVEVFASLSPSLQVATLSPAYVLIDAVVYRELMPVFWLYEEGEYFLYQGALLAAIPGTPYRDLQTPYQYGGPLSNSRDAGFLKRGAWLAYVEWCRENYVIVEFMRFHPLLHDEDFYGGEVIPNRLTVWIDLTISDLLASYETRARTTIRKAIKNGLTVEWHSGAEKAAWFTQFYQAAMREIGADELYLFPEEYFYRLLAWGQSMLAICLYENQPVAASIFLNTNLKLWSTTFPRRHDWEAIRRHESSAA